jgi:hypothetical protein
MSASIERSSEYLQLVSKNDSVSDPFSNITDIAPFTNQESFHNTPPQAYLEVSREGLTLGERSLYIDGKGNEHRTNVLGSTMYDIKVNSQTGDISAYFHQYTPYSPDQFGVMHPHKVPDRKIAFNEQGHMYQDNSPRTVGYSGIESQRVLVVTYLSKFGIVQSNYIRSENLRYALADKARLERSRLKKDTKTVDEKYIDERPLIQDEEVFLAAD